MTITMAVKLHRIGITDPKQTVLACATSGMISFPVPVEHVQFDPRSNGAKRKYQKRHFANAKERNDFYNGLKKLRAVLGTTELVIENAI
jgi:hypothetical protein